MWIIFFLCKHFPYMLQFINQQSLFDYLCKFTPLTTRYKLKVFSIYFPHILEQWIKYINDKESFIKLLQHLEIEAWIDECEENLLIFILDNFSECFIDTVTQDIVLDEILSQKNLLSLNVWDKILTIYFTIFIGRYNFFAGLIKDKILKKCPNELRNKLDMMNTLLNEGS